MRGNDCPGFYGRIMPEADSHRLELAVDWCTLMFHFDDLHCDEGSAGRQMSQFTQMATRIVRILEEPRADGADGAFMMPVCDLAERARRWGTATQLRRCAEAHRAWFLGVLWEMGHRTAATLPTLDDYADMRRHTAAGTATMAWTEIIDGEEIAARELDSPAVQALTGLALTTAAFDDDLFSYGKELWFARRERAPSSYGLNLVDILRHEHGHSRERALREAAALCDRLTHRFVALRDRVLPRASGPLRAYVDHLSHLIPGNLAWGLAADRYRNPDGLSPDAVITTGSMTGTPPKAPHTPPIPSIAWWWDPLLAM
ncbi:terpene synthase family protein [Streptomyces sp. HMX87]|uniref:terpene synthase family protein n=1 Tax=Streptomyces sp. HMX87 TaxID=3390849 RepID=UPI003A88D96E